MTEARASLDRDYFEKLYARSIDPWAFRTSAYERDKYAATLEVLARPRYRRALEVGCSIGVFTRQVAKRCDALLALDASSLALEEARRTNADLTGVEFRVATLPAEWPEGSYDLMIFSEVLYYLSKGDLASTAERCIGALAEGGDVVLCHWLGETDYPLGGDEAADFFIAAAAPRLRSIAAIRRPEYRLDLLSSSAQVG